MALSSTFILPSTYTYSKPFFSGRMPLGPGVNGSYQPGSGRRRIVGTEALHQFKIDAYNSLLAASCDKQVVGAIWAAYLRKEYTPLVVSIRFYLSDLWQSDVDGRIKHTIDAAFDMMALNDRLVVWIKDVQKVCNPADPHTEIDVSCLLLPDTQE